MRGSRRSWIGLLALCVLATPATAGAQVVGSQNTTGLAQPATTVTFSEVADYEVTTQYAPYGLLFSPPLWNYGGFLGNYDFIDGDYSGPFSIHFTAPVFAAAFQFVNAAPGTATAYLGGIQVGQIALTDDPAHFGYYYIFEGNGNAAFDQIKVALPDGEYLAYIDNVQFTPTPEPSSLLLVATGFCGLLAAGTRTSIRRRRESNVTCSR